LSWSHCGEQAGSEQGIAAGLEAGLDSTYSAIPRSRINVFMNKFRKLGFIEYNGGLKVHTSLLNVIVHD
jgi:hypothetical protein